MGGRVLERWPPLLWQRRTGTIGSTLDLGMGVTPLAAMALGAQHDVAVGIWLFV